jgi:two-component system, NarL family, sensor histidine kinase DesK
MNALVRNQIARLKDTGRAELVIVALHLPFVVVAPVLVISDHDLSLLAAIAVVANALIMGAVQLRHSLAAARNERPAGWQWSLGILAVSTYAPMKLFAWDWSVAQWFLIASVAMLVPHPWGAVAAAAPIVGTAIIGIVVFKEQGLQFGVINTIYLMVVLVMGALALYSSSRLKATIDELEIGRATLARTAVERERLRISRDLHDLLGHTLSAISLKGDLAIRLLERHDDHAARTEIAGLTGIARDALHDIHAVTRDEHAVSVRSETDAATALLRSAGIEANIHVELAHLARPVDETIAWGIREGTTNVLRHGDARSCTITAQRHDRLIRLSVVSDGAPRPTSVPSSTGTGLAGLATRARALNGTAAGRYLANDRYELLIEIPEPSQ